MAERWRPPDLFLGYLQGTEAPAEKRQRLSLTDTDRKTGLHVIGAPNTGKSKFLEHLIRQDIRGSGGLCLIDPHGALYDDVLEWCAYVRPRRPVLPLNLSTGEHIIGCNPFIDRDGHIAAQVERCMAAVTKAYGQANTDQTPRLDRVMSDLFHTIIEADDLTLCEAHYLLTQSNPQVREYLISRIRDPEVREAWQDLFKEARRFEEFMNQVDSTRSRVRRILRAATPRRALALPDPAMNLDVARVMDEGAIVLVNLKRSRRLTEQNQRLFGSLLVNAFIDAGFERDPNTARPFTLYLDEFYNFVSADIGQALPQLRKFNVRFVLAHQTLSQLRREDAEILEEVMGAVKARVVFGGLQHADALQLAPDMFAGQTDYTEAKYWRETVKFWPVYDRDRVRSRAQSHTASRAKSHTDVASETELESHSDIAGSGSQWADARSQQGSTGWSVPYLNGVPAPDGGQYFDSSGWGLVSTSGGSDMSSSADTAGRAITRGTADGTTEGTADTAGEGEADVPIYRPVPYIECQPEHYSMEEQRDRQATLLMLQFQRHCFVRSPGALTKPILVPGVPRFTLDPAIVRQYEADMAKKAGAIPSAAVQQRIDQRATRIEQQAREFAASGTADVHSTPDHEPPPTRQSGRAKGASVSLKPATRKAKASPGKDGPKKSA